MEDLITLKWYTESPIDFEHKQYVLLSYLKKVDDSFIMNPKVMNIIFKHTQGDLGYEQEIIRDEDEVIKFEPDGQYYLILDVEEYRIFNPSYGEDEV